MYNVISMTRSAYCLVGSLLLTSTCFTPNSSIVTVLLISSKYKWLRLLCSFMFTLAHFTFTLITAYKFFERRNRERSSETRLKLNIFPLDRLLSNKTEIKKGTFLAKNAKQVIEKVLEITMCWKWQFLIIPVLRTK